MMVLPTDLRAEEDGGGKKYLEGYFAVFDETYKMSLWASERFERGAFAESLENDDIRILVNHDTTLVLGRNKAGTAEFREDQHGLWGKAEINEADTAALNAWQRVQRKDVDQCSIGFRILDEEREVRPDDTVLYHVRKVRLYECSICTFPAYKSTNVNARGIFETDTEKKRELEAFKEVMKRRLEKWD